MGCLSLCLKSTLLSGMWKAFCFFLTTLKPRGCYEVASVPPAKAQVFLLCLCPHPSEVGEESGILKPPWVLSRGCITGFLYSWFPHSRWDELGKGAELFLRNLLLSKLSFLLIFLSSSSSPSKLYLVSEVASTYLPNCSCLESFGFGLLILKEAVLL